MLTQHKTYEDVSFDSAKISPETVTALIDMGSTVDDNVMIGSAILEAYKGTQTNNNTAIAISQEDAAKLVDTTITDMHSDAELKKDLDSQSPEDIEKLKLELVEALLTGVEKDNDAVSHECVNYDKTLKEFFHYIDNDNTTDVFLDGEMVMQVSGKNRTSTRKAIQAFFVVLDVLFLIYAILSMPQCKPTKDAIEQLIKEFGKKISSAANTFISALSSVFSGLKSAHASGAGPFMTAVKNAAKAIGNAVVTCVKAIWDNRKGLSLLKKITTAVFKAATGSIWKALYYVGQFVLGIISLIAGPAAMVAKVAALISALAALIVDSIELANMSSESIADAVA